jgi:hypothetical protein
LPVTSRTAKIAAASLAGLTSLALAGLAISGPALAGTTTAAHRSAGSRPADHHSSSFKVSIVINGADLSHTFTPAGSTTPETEHLTSPDDVAILGHDLFTTFQNGVGPQGQPSADGNDDSTIVEFTPNGHVVNQWDLVGKCDGLTGDPQRHIVIATIDEDANSSLYTIAPGAKPGAQLVHYQYNSNPLPHHGGTDAISIYHGLILISASAPGTVPATPTAPNPAFPAVYVAHLDPSTQVATMTPLFYDEANATVANTNASNYGQTTQLALTDPDSNEVVPASGPRFAGDFMLTSQGDMEQIFVEHGGKQFGHGHDSGKLGSKLAVLKLTNSVDDTAWAGRSGFLIAASTSTSTVDMVTGPFRLGTIFTAVTPCDANDAPATCPAPGFPPNYLGTLNPWTGQLTAVTTTGATLEPQGMLFIESGHGHGHGHHHHGH